MGRYNRGVAYLSVLITTTKTFLKGKILRTLANLKIQFLTHKYHYEFLRSQYICVCVYICVQKYFLNTLYENKKFIKNRSQFLE
jgi:hypothetical protein